MRTPAFIILCLLTALDASGEYAMSNLRVFPNSQRVSRNAIFMLEGYAESQPIVNKLNVDYPVYLLSGSKRIRLLVKERYVGQFNLTQAIMAIGARPDIPFSDRQIACL